MLSIEEVKVQIGEIVSHSRWQPRQVRIIAERLGLPSDPLLRTVDHYLALQEELSNTTLQRGLPYPFDDQVIKIGDRATLLAKYCQNPDRLLAVWTVLRFDGDRVRIESGDVRIVVLLHHIALYGPSEA